MGSESGSWEPVIVASKFKLVVETQETVEGKWRLNRSHTGSDYHWYVWDSLLLPAVGIGTDRRVIS